MTTVVVFGGGGFLGRRLVHRLTTEGMSVRVAVRHPDRARIELRSMGFDRVTVVPADVRDQASVSAAVAGANAVVNMVIFSRRITSRAVPCRVSGSSISNLKRSRR
jgi:nucleoside-diphosphate-sugar epimerase